MRTIPTALTLAAVLALPQLAHADASEWKIDPAHTRVGFSVPHMVVSDVEGRFTRFSGSVHIDDAKPQRSKVKFEVEVASIDTDNDKRDEHLRSADFFDAASHPTIVFESTQVTKAGKAYRVKGNLTIRGVTKSVTLKVALSPAVTNPWGQKVRAVKVEGELDRKDFGLTWNKALDAGGFLVGDEVSLEIRMELNG